MRTSLAIAALAFVCTSTLADGEVAWTPEELLAAAIEYHDPEAAWSSGAYRLVVEQSRPNGVVNEAKLSFDNRRGTFSITSMREGALIHGRLTPEGCSYTIDGSAEISDQQREKHNLTCDRLRRVRNYYVYLWGLPMKLQDAGTIVGHDVAAVEFQDRDTLRIRVTYDLAVGNDTWYFYFDPDTKALAGYRFYHEELENDGEYITLDGELAGAGLRLPRTRAWYMNDDDKYLGTDTLQSIEALAD